ncbi:MAG: hypothetical protein ACTSUI_00390 [Promethearchaeota archaeon]
MYIVYVLNELRLFYGVPIIFTGLFLVILKICKDQGSIKDNEKSEKKHDLRN